MAGSKKLVGKTLHIAQKMLHDVCGILEEEGIPYTLEAGTLLGIVRENRLLPWDTDLDITVTSDYTGQLIAILHRMEKAGYRIKIRRYDRDIAVMKKNQPRIIKIQTRRLFFFKGISLMDIFIKYKDGDKYLWTVDESNPVLKKCPAEFYDNRTLYEFDSKLFWIPSTYNDYLTYHYGLDWRKAIKNWDFRLDDHCDKELVNKAEKRRYSSINALLKSLIK